MTKLPREPHASRGLGAPIKALIDDALPEADVQRIWRDVQARSSERAPLWRAGWLAVGAACALALAGALAWRTLATPARSAAPLAIVGDHATRSGLGVAQVFGGAQPTRLAFDDGSQIDLGGATQLEVLENSSHRFATRLQRGRGEFEVTPGGPRRWSIECGVVTVEVVGTHFAIDRSEDGVRVAVARGVVMVRGARVAGRAQRLTAGQTLHVPSIADAVTPTSDARPAPAVATDAVAATVAVPAAATAAVPALTSVPPAQALPAAPRAAASAELWLQQADEARRHGQSERALHLLERIVQRAQGSPHAAIAALTLARLTIDSQPARAAAALASVDDARAPQSLREDIMAYLVQAHARAGHADLAQQAAVNYMRAFPHGRRGDDVRQWTNAP